jgi:hypothetical protein
MTARKGLKVMAFVDQPSWAVCLNETAYQIIKPTRTWYRGSHRDTTLTSRPDLRQ